MFWCAREPARESIISTSADNPALQMNPLTPLGYTGDKKSSGCRLRQGPGRWNRLYVHAEIEVLRYIKFRCMTNKVIIAS